MFEDEKNERSVSKEVLSLMYLISKGLPMKEVHV